jgi:hypothetical protein
MTSRKRRRVEEEQTGEECHIPTWEMVTAIKYLSELIARTDNESMERELQRAIHGRPLHLITAETKNSSQRVRLFSGSFQTSGKFQPPP